jgi:type IV secretory pathway protease TraF
MWRWLIRVLVVLYLVLSMAACQMTMTAARFDASPSCSTVGLGR